jgi:hypothetical protein
MLRKSMVALLAIAAAALLAPDTASARGGFGGFRGGGGFGGFRAAGIGMGNPGFRAAAIGGGYRVAGMRTGTFAQNAWRTGFYPGYRPFRRFPVAAAAVVGAGLAYGAYPYGYGDYDNGYYDNAYYSNGYYGNGNAYYPPYDYDGNYVYNSSGYYGDGGCTIVQRRIPTPYGWVLRPVQVCN